jgi:hypothetical protein
MFQSREFKEVVTPERQAATTEHQYMTEYLMFEKAYGIQDSFGNPLRMGNPIFAQRLSIECPDYPTLLKTPTPPALMGMPPMGGPPGGPLPPASGLLQAEPLGTGAPMEVGGSAAPPPLPPQPPSSIGQ